MMADTTATLSAHIVKLEQWRSDALAKGDTRRAMYLKRSIQDYYRKLRDVQSAEQWGS